MMRIMIKMITKEIPLDSTASLLLCHPVCTFLYIILSLSVFFHHMLLLSFRHLEVWGSLIFVVLCPCGFIRNIYWGRTNTKTSENVWEAFCELSKGFRLNRVECLFSGSCAVFIILGFLLFLNRGSDSEQHSLFCISWLADVYFALSFCFWRSSAWGDNCSGFLLVPVSFVFICDCIKWCNYAHNFF